MRARWLVLLAAGLLVMPGCALLYPPPTTLFLFPALELSSDTLSPESYGELVDGHEAQLRTLTIGVLENPNRRQWSSRVAGDIVDERPDENALLAEFLGDTGVFGEVILVQTPADSRADFVLSCSVECLYNIELDDWMFTFNCITLGIGFLLGWPHQDPEAFYVAQAVFYDSRGDDAVVVAGSLVTNHKEWYCDNIYWRPDFYEDDSLEPLFRQTLYDFLARSGCLGAEGATP
ncbi:MAG: hypothetical protein AB1486_23475 [Planctomycetota bacterium]